MIFKPNTRNDLHPEHDPSAFANQNAQFAIPAVGRETFHPDPLPSTYDFGQISPSMIPLHWSQNRNTIPVEQALPTSPFSPSLESGNSTTNPIWDQSFVLNADLLLPSYGTSNYGQYSPNGYTNASYGNFDSGPSQFPPLPTQPATIFNPNQPNMTSSKPYACPSGCGKSFTRKADMQRHDRGHGPSSLWCNVQECNKGFYRKDKLDEHMKTHKKG